MRKIQIPPNAKALHSLRFSSYLEELVGALAGGYDIVDKDGQSLSLAGLSSDERALTDEYFSFFADFIDAGGDLAVSDPEETWQLVKTIDAFFDVRGLSRDSNLVNRWNDVWMALVSYSYFTGNQAPRFGVCVDNGRLKWQLRLDGSKEIKWNTYEFVKELGITICPYCNFMPLPLERIRKETHDYQMSPDMDHYLKKSEYPYLALNLYNLIPACDVCNRRIKENRLIDFQSVAHPYVDDVHAEVKVHASDNAIKNPDRYGRPGNEFPLRGMPSPGVEGLRGKAFLDFFGVLDRIKNQVYQSRIKRIVINATQKRKLFEFYRGQYGRRLSDRDVECLIFECSLNPDEINKQSFSKVTIDLVKQVDGLLNLGAM